MNVNDEKQKIVKKKIRSEVIEIIQFKTKTIIYKREYLELPLD